MNTADTASVTALEIPGYEVLRKLGSGGMGTVYLARQTALNRHVAIKVLDRVDDSSAVRRFERESLLAASVTHPNIVFIVDSGTVDGVPYLVQEFIDGSSLAEMLADRRLNATEICELLAPIVDALAQLHQAGVLHRDFKPRNVLIDARGRPMLSDFGLAVCIESGSALTQTGIVVGTFDYMAPEQRHRLHVDERADQYSLAAVTYEMLTGEKPLGAFKRPSELNPQLPPAVDSILLRALSRDPDDRFPDVTSFFGTLQKVLRRAGSPALQRLFSTVVLTAVVSSLLTWAIVTYERPRSAMQAGSGGSPEDHVVAELLATQTSSSANEVDLAAMTVAELRDYARDQGLTGYSGLSWSALQELVESGGQQIELPPGWTSEIRTDAADRRYRWYISPDGKSFRSPPAQPSTGTDAISNQPATVRGDVPDNQ